MERIEFHGQRGHRVAPHAEERREAPVVSGVATESVIVRQCIRDCQVKCTTYGFGELSVRDPTESHTKHEQLAISEELCWVLDPIADGPRVVTFFAQWLRWKRKVP